MIFSNVSIMLQLCFNNKFFLVCFIIVYLLVCLNFNIKFLLFFSLTFIINTPEKNSLQKCVKLIICRLRQNMACFIIKYIIKFYEKRSIFAVIFIHLFSISDILSFVSPNCLGRFNISDISNLPPVIFTFF